MASHWLSLPPLPPRTWFGGAGWEEQRPFWDSGDGTRLQTWAFVQALLLIGHETWQISLPLVPVSSSTKPSQVVTLCSVVFIECPCFQGLGCLEDLKEIVSVSDLSIVNPAPTDASKRRNLLVYVTEWSREHLLQVGLDLGPKYDTGTHYLICFL